MIIQAVFVFVSYLPFFNSIFRQTNTPFSQNRQYPTPFYLSVLYYHGNPGLLRESILLPVSTIFAPIAILSAASKNQKIGVHHPPWWTPPSLKNLDFKPFFNTFACEYPCRRALKFILYRAYKRHFVLSSSASASAAPTPWWFLCSTFQKSRIYARERIVVRQK